MQWTLDGCLCVRQGKKRPVSHNSPHLTSMHRIMLRQWETVGEQKMISGWEILAHTWNISLWSLLVSLLYNLSQDQGRLSSQGIAEGASREATVVLSSSTGTTCMIHSIQQLHNSNVPILQTEKIEAQAYSERSLRTSKSELRCTT